MAVNDVTSMGGLNQNQFIQLLIAGLRNQDPMQPMDSQSFLQQLAQFANLQGIQNLNANFSDMLKLQQLTEGANLIGRVVHYVADGTEAAGRVSSLSVRDGKIILAVGPREIGLDQVTYVGAT